MAQKRPKSSNLADNRVEHVLAAELRRLIVMLWPWPLWLVLAVAGWKLHKAWPSLGTAGMVVAATLALAGLALHLTHARTTLLAKLLAPATTLTAGTWLALAEVYGVHGLLFQLWLIGGIAVCIGWSMWLHIHDSGDEQHLGLSAAAEHTGIPGLRGWVVERLPNRLTGVLQHPPGVTSAEVTKAVPALTAALSAASPAGMPMGALQVISDPDRADRSRFVLSDPRLLDKPRLWPGPSHPGGSFADPIRYGTFTDGTVCQQVAENYHVQIMGKSGAGKTTGPGYCELAETVSRNDAAVIAFDPAKRLQFLGPLRPALHYLALDAEDTRRMLWRLSQLQPARTDYLAALGLQRWQKGCGLTHITAWFEEASWLFNKCVSDADVERWVVPFVVAARSAGIRCVFSIQRADFTMMPTAIRAQMCRITCGVAGGEDADFGLTDYQSNHGCEPSQWGSEKPGMFYIDVDGLPQDYKIMPARSFYWGPDSAMIAHYAAQWPATSRPLDPLSAAHLFPPATTATEPSTVKGQPAKAKPATSHQPPAQAADTGAAPPYQPATRQGEPPSEEELMGDHEPTGAYDDPSLYRPAEGTTAADYAATDDGLPAGAADITFGQPAAEDNVSRMPQTLEQATEALRRQVRQWWDQGITTITLDMVLELTTDPQHPNYIDRSRPWLYPAMAALVDDPAMGLEQHDNPRCWSRAAA